jgi:small subunit ribosomal protein S20
MPHTRSAEKHLRRSGKRRLHNRAVSRDIKAQIKKFLAVLEKGPAAEVRKEFNLVAKVLDKAAARRVIHCNQAARRKSRLAKLLLSKEKAGKPQ